MIPAGYILAIETEHFSFEAHGRTEPEARETMARTLAAHGKQYDLPDDWAAPYFADVEARPFCPGVGTRDGSEIA